MLNRIQALLCLVFFSVPAWSVEWDQAFFSAGASALLAAQPDEDDYPLAAGLAIHADYQVPVFVEGHTRAYLLAALDWARFRPDVDDAMHGSSSYGITATAGLLQDIQAGDRLLWLGGGLGLQSLHRFNHYSWEKNGTIWSQARYGDEQDFALMLQGQLQIPVTPTLRIDTHVNWPVSQPGLATFRVGASLEFK